MLISKLTTMIKAIEGRIAYGSQSILWGDYIDRITNICGVCPTSDSAYDATVPTGEASWWLRAYHVLETLGDISVEQVCHYIDYGVISNDD